jgi:nicotinamidase-related amidase
MASFVESKTKNVLIVVDVQNCFMKNMFGGNGLNQNNEDDCIQMAKEIANLTKKNDIVVFTRDLHPLNHISFGEGSEGRDTKPTNTWPIHCRNKLQTCSLRDGRTNDNISEPVYEKKFSDLTMDYKDKIFEEKIKEYINTKQTYKDRVLADTFIKGNLLSYYFYGTDINEIIYELNKNALSGFNKIGMKRSMSEVTLPNQATEINDTDTISDIEWKVKPFEKNNKKYITLSKGERCNKESYSAFNYHIDYNITNPSEPTRKDDFISIHKDNSTGLWEWLIDIAKNENISQLNITVCGLVGNVCVMHTVLEGKAMWEALYKTENPTINVDFCFSLVGTLFLDFLPPGGSVKVKKDDIINKKLAVEGLGEKTFKDFLQLNFPKGGITFKEAFPNFDSLELFTPFDERGGAQQMGGKKYKKCPKCKKNHYNGGKCFICGFIPFLGKTKTQKRKRGNGKKTRKNKRRITRRN